MESTGKRNFQKMAEEQGGSALGTRGEEGVMPVLGEEEEEECKVRKYIV